MKGILVGFEPVDYVSKKTGKQVEGCTLYLNCKSQEAFGYVCKEEFVSKSSPLYKRSIEPVLEKLCDESSDIYGATVIIDYDVTKRGNSTFTDITEMTFEVAEKAAKKAG